MSRRRGTRKKAKGSKKKGKQNQLNRSRQPVQPGTAGDTDGGPACHCSIEIPSRSGQKYRTADKGRRRPCCASYGSERQRAVSAVRGGDRSAGKKGWPTRNDTSERLAAAETPLALHAGQVRPEGPGCCPHGSPNRETEKGWGGRRVVGETRDMEEALQRQRGWSEKKVLRARARARQRQRAKESKSTLGREHIRGASSHKTKLEEEGETETNAKTKQPRHSCVTSVEESRANKRCSSPRQALPSWPWKAGCHRWLLCLFHRTAH